MFYPSLVLAILAAVIASQTMITATFQVLIEPPTFSKTHGANLNAAAFANNQAVILSANQGSTHVQTFPWTNLHPVGELAVDDRNDYRDRRLQ